MWIKREISEILSRSVEQFPALILTGARQVGKTSLLQRLYPDRTFVTLDLPTNAELAEREPGEFLKRYPPPVIIDEVQYAPGLFRHLKGEIDKNRDDYGRFILTGSQKFTLMKSVSDSLAGRSAVFELETLAAREILSARRLTEAEMMVRGGMPELNARPELDRNTFCQSYVATYLERDVRTILNIAQLRDFERFLRACALRSGQVLNKSELARDVGVSPTTANEWLSVLSASNQVVLLEPWFSNKTKSLIKSPKLYLADAGLMCYLVGIDSVDDLARSPMAGAVWETFVFSEIRKRSVFKHGRWDVWLWRDSRGLEIDFLINRGGRFKLIEAKLSEAPERRDAERLKKVASLLGDKSVDRMAIVSRTKQRFPMGDGVDAISLGELDEYL